MEKKKKKQDINKNKKCITFSNFFKSIDVCWKWIKKSQSGRVILDVLEISNSLALEGFLATVDIEKAFDPVNQYFYCKFFKNSNLV